MSNALPAMDNVQHNAGNCHEVPHLSFSHFSCSIICSNYVQNSYRHSKLRQNRKHHTWPKMVPEWQLSDLPCPAALNSYRPTDA